MLLHSTKSNYKLSATILPLGAHLIRAQPNEKPFTPQTDELRPQLTDPLTAVSK